MRPAAVTDEAPDTVPPREGAARPAQAPLGVLRRREFAIFWAGQTLSLVGTWMQSFAQGWVVAGMTTSASALGLVNFAMSVPTLLLMPLGGVAADRMDRRGILIATQWVMLILAFVVGGLLATGRLELWHIYIVALLLGISTAFELPAYQSFYPQLVEKEDLPQAISLNQASFHGARIVGPALAGWLVAKWGLAAAFFANGASFLAVLISLALIRARPPASGAATAAPIEMMKEGFRFVRERPALQCLLGLTAITTLFIFPNLAVLTPYYIKHVLHEGADALGLLMSISGAGALLGSALLLSAPAEQRIARIGLCSAGILLTMTLLAWSTSLWLSIAAVAVQSLAISHSLGLASIMVQELLTDEIRGRVMSLYSLAFTGIMPFAALLIPALADWWGMRLELQFSGVLYAVTAVLLVLRLRSTAAAERLITPEPPKEVY